jgi:hypothetical protein
LTGDGAPLSSIGKHDPKESFVEKKSHPLLSVVVVQQQAPEAQAPAPSPPGIATGGPPQSNAP